MARSHDIKLPIYQDVTFPKRCVVCGEQAPRNRMTVKTRAVTFLILIIQFFGYPGSGEKIAVSVPVCRGCGWRYKIGKWVWGEFMWIFIIAGTIVMVPVVRAWCSEDSQVWMILTTPILLYALMNFFIFIFPPSIDLKSFGKNVTYEFRDKEYAKDFAIINEAYEQVGLTKEELFPKKQEKKYVEEVVNEDEYEDYGY